jgi:AraC-like DNA-binding protein
MPEHLIHGAIITFPDALGTWDIDAPPLDWQGWIVWLCLRGSMDLECGGRTYAMQPGQALFMPLDVRPCRQRRTGTTTQRIGFLHCTADERPTWRRLPQREVGVVGHVAQCFANAVRSLWQAPKVADDWLRIVLDGIDRSRCDPLPSAHRQAIDGVVEAIAGAPGRSWTVADLAARCRLSAPQFNRLFRNRIGMTPADFIIQERMRLACTLLHMTHQSLAEIATTCGYADEHALSRRFTAVIGLRPSVWRRQQR